MSRNATRQSVIVRAEGRAARAKPRCHIPASPPPPPADHRSSYDKYPNERVDSGYSSLLEPQPRLWTPVDKVMTHQKVDSTASRHYNSTSKARRDGEKSMEMTNGQSDHQQSGGKDKGRSGSAADFRYKPYAENEPNSFDNSGRIIQDQQRFMLSTHRHDEANWPRTTVHPEHLALISTDVDGDLPLHLAVAKEDEAGVNYIIQCMLSQRLSLDFCNKRLQTPLHLAVLTGHLGIIKVLLSNGACPRLPDRQGNTAVHLAVKSSTLQALQQLLECPSALKTLSRKNNSGFTPLHLAIFRKSTSIIAHLVSKGSDCNCVDGTSGRTPLYHAVSEEQEDIVSTLISFGASVNLPSFAGVTPLVVATDKRLKNISRLLISKGATMSAKDEL